MAKDYHRLWKGITNANNEAKAVRTLTEILSDKEGKGFISNLERRDAELCIEILDRVSHDLNLDPSFIALSGSVRALQTTILKLQRNKTFSIR
jgi:hypothetical protein